MTPSTWRRKVERLERRLNSQKSEPMDVNADNLIVLYKNSKNYMHLMRSSSKVIKKLDKRNGKKPRSNHTKLASENTSTGIEHKKVFCGDESNNSSLVNIILESIIKYNKSKEAMLKKVDYKDYRKYDKNGNTPGDASARSNGNPPGNASARSNDRYIRYEPLGHKRIVNRCNQLKTDLKMERVDECAQTSLKQAIRHSETLKSNENDVSTSNCTDRSKTSNYQKKPNISRSAMDKFLMNENRIMDDTMSESIILEKFSENSYMIWLKYMNSVKHRVNALDKLLE